MLQIISRKFFDESLPINEKECDAVLFGNFCWAGPIKTSVAELRPTESVSTDVAAFSIRYANVYQPKPEKDILIQASGGEAVDQFRLLCALWFRSLFHEDRNYIEHLCRSSSRLSTVSEPVPKDFVREFFDCPKRGTSGHIEGFSGFVDRVIGMPRLKYRRFILCLNLFHHALEAIGTSFDLAYSMFVYLLEALSKSAHEYTPRWEDYDQNVRVKLDKTLAAIDSIHANDVRTILLEGAQLKLTKRFVEFVSAHVDDSFFTTEVAALDRAVAKKDLEQTLRNLYQTRSGFVHELRKLNSQLSMPGIGNNSDIFTWENQPYLTMAGLVHLTHHVLMQYSCRQEHCVKEDYSDWRNELPGIVKVEVAPRYWIWQAGGFSPKQAKRRFSGFMEHMEGQVNEPNFTIPDMRDVLREVEKQFGQAAKPDKVAMLALYFVVHNLVSTPFHLPNCVAFLEKHNAVADPCGIEFMASFVFLGRNLPWSVEDCQETLKLYHRQKYKRNTVQLPRRLEIAIGSRIANLQLQASESTAFSSALAALILDGSGFPDVQDELKASRDELRPVEIDRLLGRPEKQDVYGTYWFDWV